MVGEQEAVVLDVKPFGLHGVTYYDVTVQFSDNTVEHSRLGPEGVPADLQRRYATLASACPKELAGVWSPSPTTALPASAGAERSCVHVSTPLAW